MIEASPLLQLNPGSKQAQRFQLFMLMPELMTEVVFWDDGGQKGYITEDFEIVYPGMYKHEIEERVKYIEDNYQPNNSLFRDVCSGLLLELTTVTTIDHAKRVCDPDTDTDT